MSRALVAHRAGPSVTVQDMGRPGYLGFGVSRGGAVDTLALAEGAALLGQPVTHAALEMAGFGGEFEATEPVRIALTGAPMRATLDGSRIAWNASHLLAPGSRLSIGAVERGSYGYLHTGGGIATPMLLGARSAHLAAGLGGLIRAGDRLPVGADRDPGHTGYRLDPEPRFDGGTIRVVPSVQTEFFATSERERFEATVFRRDNRGNRMGVRLILDGEGFHSKAGLSVLSEVIVPGDIQVTGDGTPFVLLSECQTTGGYPRIGSVLPEDLPRVAQTQAGAVLRFRFVTIDDGVEAERRGHARRAGLRTAAKPLIRAPETIADLLSYQLVSGVTAGDDLDRSGP
jgi:allophanate hydrolase